uniref:Uncharacterized protein n=1 Tax=Lepeophtheirus salmonis TaxID=72036 RepID=A0A0K2UTF2_LEPSM
MVNISFDFLLVYSMYSSLHFDEEMDCI